MLLLTRWQYRRMRHNRKYRMLRCGNRATKTTVNMPRHIQTQEIETQQRIQDYEVRLQSSDDVSRHTISELRQLLIFYLYQLLIMISLTDDNTGEWDPTEDRGLRSAITELRRRQSAYDIRTQEMTYYCVCYLQMTILENETQQRIQDYEVRLQSSDDVSRHTISELRKLLQAQQRMSARWGCTITLQIQIYETIIDVSISGDM